MKSINDRIKTSVATTTDDVDKALLFMLQQDATMSLKDLQRRLAELGLVRDEATISRRKQNLLDNGIIKVQAVVQDVKVLGYALSFLTFVRIRKPKESENMHDVLKEFEAKVNSDFHQAIECRKVTGKFTYVLKVVARSAEDYDHFVTELTGLRYIKDTFSISIMGEVTAPVPIHDLVRLWRLVK